MVFEKCDIHVVGEDFSYAKNPSKFEVLRESQFIYVDAKFFKVHTYWIR